MSPMAAMLPSGRRAVMPEMKTSLPLASASIACEKWPIGSRTLSVRIWRFVM
jgi:hypothetical protein